MNIELNKPGMKQIKTSFDLLDAYNGYRMLFGSTPDIYYTGKLEKDENIICDGTVKIVGWSPLKRDTIAFDISIAESCKAKDEYALFFVKPDSLSHRFKSGCTCRLITVSENSCYIGSESDCPVHGFGE